MASTGNGQRDAYIQYMKCTPMYRGGLNEELSDVAQSFSNSLHADMELMPFDIAATEAHILMLYESRIIPKEDTKNILAALRDIRMGNLDAAALEDKRFEDCHEMLEAVITKKAGEVSGGRLQTARSRNDQVAVAIRMKLRHDTHTIQAGILELAAELLRIAAGHMDTIIPLYTHLQHAQVGVLSHYLLAYAEILVRDYGRFADMYKRLNSNPLGAGPVGGSSIAIDRQTTSKLLAFPNIVTNSLDATSSRDHVSEFVSCASILCVNLSRIAEDLVLWSSDEFGFVDISDPFASPSSAMPQKKNPDVLELVRGKAASTIGDMVGVLSIQKGLASGYGRDLQEAKEPAWRASNVVIGSLKIVLNVFSDITIHTDRMAAAARSGNTIALDVAEELVRQEVPFREAHAEVGRMAAAARRTGKQIVELGEDDIAKICHLDPGLIRRVLATCTVEASADMRRSTGGTARQEQVQMLDDIRHDVAHMLKELELQRNRESEKMDEMRSRIDEFLG